MFLLARYYSSRQSMVCKWDKKYNEYIFNEFSFYFNRYYTERLFFNLKINMIIKLK